MSRITESLYRVTGAELIEARNQENDKINYILKKWANGKRLSKIETHLLLDRGYDITPYGRIYNHNTNRDLTKDDIKELHPDADIAGILDKPNPSSLDKEEQVTIDPVLPNTFKRRGYGAKTDKRGEPDGSKLSYNQFKSLQPYEREKTRIYDLKHISPEWRFSYSSDDNFDGDDSPDDILNKAKELHKAKKLTESACTRLADTDAQEETINKIEKLAKSCGINLSPGTKVGKRPQRVILDWHHQDGFVSVSANGSFSIGDKDFGSYKDSYFDVNEVSSKEIKACFSSYLNEGQTWRALKDPISKLYKEKEELAWELESMQKGSFDHAPDPSAWDLLREKEIRDRLKEINKQLEEFENDPITQEIDPI